METCLSTNFPSASIPNCRQVITHNRVRSNPTGIDWSSNFNWKNVLVERRRIWFDSCRKLNGGKVIAENVNAESKELKINDGK